MSDLGEVVAFIRAQLDEDERVAKAATPGPWSSDPTGTVCADADLKPDGHGGEILPEGGPMEVAECYRNERAGERGCNAEHIARHDPAHVLAKVAADRRILGRHALCSYPDHAMSYGNRNICAYCETDWPCPDVCDLAAGYADRDGFRQEWAA